MALATNYTNGELNTEANTQRVYRFTLDGAVLFEGVVIEEITSYIKNPSVYGAPDINETNQVVNDITPEAGEDITV